MLLKHCHDSYAWSQCFSREKGGSCALLMLSFSAILTRRTANIVYRYFLMFILTGYHFSRSFSRFNWWFIGVCTLENWKCTFKNGALALELYLRYVLNQIFLSQTCSVSVLLAKRCEVIFAGLLQSCNVFALP